MNNDATAYNTYLIEAIQEVFRVNISDAETVYREYEYLFNTTVDSMEAAREEIAVHFII